MFLTENGWDSELMQEHLPSNTLEHVRMNMGNFTQTREMDKPWWIKNNTGKFTVKSVWEILRKKFAPNNDFMMLWVKGLPFKISFFEWRVWTHRVLVAAVMAAYNPTISQMCQCCRIPMRETIEHLFLTGEEAIFIWDYYARYAGLLGP